ncbi:MAG: phytoene/squalene synthase family protein [SAR202 cluster bacterium]|jgi:farnesyl-diphosphate farnesyltransferase|nr:phytoene/squalene synthase family protein [SAR202 cluster bacterium]MDP6513255.1 phytoene/squalene synthase family protein [SAR202 cluster bacterium]MDP6714996.1 phytoene/squalene synthase family protein [SAR202 cluster bacterium]
MANANRVNPIPRQKLLTELLKSVSRAFYLTLRVLPTGLREPIGLAYLLARAVDTIVDTRSLPRDERVRFLLSLRKQLQEGVDLGALNEMTESLVGQQSSNSERRLLESLPQAFELLEAMSTQDAIRVRGIVVTLTLGMEFDLTTFPDEESGELRALENADDLDQYTYMVAGCVGEFWTDISVDRTRALRKWDQTEMLELGVRFGKALQMTNVLRDVPGDLRIGRCYLPKSELDALGVSPEDLMSPATGDRARPVLADGIRLALDHYSSAESYLSAIPRRCVRLRLAVAWPLLIGLGTLDVLAKNQRWLDPDHPSKVSRGWVYRMLTVSVIGILSNDFMQNWIKRLRQKIDRAL